MIDGKRLNEVVRSNIETLCRHFFPAGHKDGGEWKIADVSGSNSHSMIHRVKVVHDIEAPRGRLR